MIRVGIVSKSLFHARDLAELLSEDERIEVIDFRSFSGEADTAMMVDVLVCAGIAAEHLPRDSSPAVVLSDEPAASSPQPRTVRAWLPENVLASELSAAVIAVAAGFTVLTQSQAEEHRRSGHPDPTYSHEVEKLTPREGQVLAMLADGLGNKEIANELGISDHTAKFHVAQILGKLGAGSRAEAVAIGMRRGLVAV